MVIKRHPLRVPFSLCTLFLLGLLNEVQKHLVHQVGVPARFQPFFQSSLRPWSRTLASVGVRFWRMVCFIG